MATVTLRPNETVEGDIDPFGGADWVWTSWATDGSPDVADDNASTTWYNGNPHPDGQERLSFAFNTFAIPADAVVTSVTMRVRWRAAAALGATVKDRAAAGTERQVGDLVGAGFNNPNTNTETMAAQTTNPSGGAWSQSDIDNLRIVIQKTSGAGLEIHEIYADVVYNVRPSVTVSEPTGTISTTNQPDVVWAYSDTEADAQAQYHVKVFTSTSYGSGSFDPDTFPAQWDSGATAGAAGTVQVGDALPADVTMKAYVRVADSLQWSDWAAGPEFTILASGHDKPGRVFFGLTSGPGSSGAGFWEFDDTNREGSFSFKSAPFRDPSGRQVEIRAVTVYCKSYDADAFITVTVNGTARTQTMTVPGRHHLRFQFSERNEVLDVKVESEAGDTAVSEAPTIEVVRIGWRPNHLLR